MQVYKLREFLLPRLMNVVRYALLKRKENSVNRVISVICLMFAENFWIIYLQITERVLLSKIRIIKQTTRNIEAYERFF